MSDELLQSLKGWHSASHDRVYADVEPAWPDVSRVPQWRFQKGAAVIESRVPIEVTLRHEDGEAYVESEKLHIFASGKSVAAAMEDFSCQLVHFYEHYTGLEADEVVGMAAQLRAIYIAEFEAKVTDAA
jgi:hypothetical protein